MLRWPLLPGALAALTLAAGHRADPPLRHETRAISFQLDASPAVVFPLFGPRLEARWANGWAPRFAFPLDSIAPLDGAVFTVTHGGRESTWLLTRNDSAAMALEYAVVSPGFTAALLQITVVAAPDHRAVATVRYSFTALSADGNGFVEHWANAFPAEGPHWAAAINDYLARSRSDR